MCKSCEITDISCKTYNPNYAEVMITYNDGTRNARIIRDNEITVIESVLELYATHQLDTHNPNRSENSGKSISW